MTKMNTQLECRYMGIPRIRPMRQPDALFKGLPTISLAQDADGGGKGQVLEERPGNLFVLGEEYTGRAVAPPLPGIFVSADSKGFAGAGRVSADSARLKVAVFSIV
jgi:hypothetical protein